MNEEEIAALIANGYSYTGGGIIDSEGQYHKSVNLFGVDYNSVNTEEDYNAFLENTERVETQREEKRIAREEEKNRIAEFEKNPLQNNLGDISEDTYAEYMQEKTDKNEPGAYDFQEDFVEKNEKAAIQKDLENNQLTGESLQTKTVFTEMAKDKLFQDKDINFDILNEVIPVEKEIKTIEELDPDFDTTLKEERKATSKEIEETPWYNPKLISLYAKQGLNSMYSALSPDGTFMEDDKLKKEYVELNDKRKNLLTPELEKITAVLEEEKSFYDKDYEDNYSTVGSLFGREDQDINNYVRRQLQSKVDYLKSFTDDSDVYNLLSEEFLSNTFTAGLRDGHDALKYRMHLANKLNDGETLTETEQRAVENLGRIDLIDGLNLEQNVGYNLTYGAGHSVTFLAGGIGGRAVGKGVGKAVTKGTTNLAGKGVLGKATSKLATDGATLAAQQSVGRAVGLTTDIATQSVLHTSNIANTIDNYNGKIHMGFDENGKMEIQTDRMQYKALKNEIAEFEDGLAAGLGNEQQRQYAKEHIKQLKEILANTKEPQSVAGALGKSVTGNFVEAASEVATMGVLKGIPNNLVTRKLTEGFRKTPKWAKLNAKAKQLTAKPGKILETINKPFPKTMEALNNFSGGRVGGNVTIGSNLEEALEEVVVQITPVWGETDKEAAARKNELLKGSFYFNVLAQAPIQKLIMSPVGIGVRGANYLGNNLDKDYRETKRNFKSLMKDLEKQGITKGDVDEIMMAAGSGNFSQVEYKNKIKELDDQGKHEEANKIRENRIFNAAFKAIKFGKGKQFISALEKSLAVQDSPTTMPSEAEAKTRVATVQALTEAKALMQETKKTEGMPNQEYILNLGYHKRNAEKNVSQIKKDIADLQGQAESTKRDEDIAMYENSLAETEKSLTVLNNKIAEENSPSKLKEYRDEAEMAIFATAHTKKLKERFDAREVEEGDATKGRQTELLPLNEAMKNAFGTSVSKKSYEKVEKLFEGLNILETAAAEMTPPVVANTPPAPAASGTPNPFGAGSVSADIEQEVEDLGESFREETIKDIEEIEQAVAEMNLEGGVDIFMGMDEDEMVSVLDESDSEVNPLVSIGNKMKMFSDKTKQRTGKSATFEDFLMAVGANGMMIEDYQEYLTLFGNAWSHAGLGKVDLVKKYNRALQMAKSLRDMGALANLEVVDTPEASAKLEEEEKVLGLLDKNEKPERDVNGIPVIVQKRDEVYDELHRVNYSALEFIEEEVVNEETGEVYIRRVNAPIPVRNSTTPTNVNNLVHPSKNNKGDKLTVGKPSIEEVGNTYVSIRDENGKTTKRVKFSEWVEMSRGTMSIEAFSKTDAYIGKLPMHYVDSEGQNVGWIAESEWFNPATEGENDGRKIKVSNLSDIEKAEIEQKRVSALNLRKEILAGNVEEFEITTDGSSYVRLKVDKDENGNLIPPMKLSEVAKTSHIAVMGTSGLNFVDGSRLDTSDILNWGNSDTGFSKKVMRTSEDGKSQYAEVENAGKTVYVEHVTTINGVKKYVATLTLRKNEDGKNQAQQSAIETVRILAAANTILMNDTFSVIRPGNIPFIAKNNPNRMTKEQAQQIHDQVKAVTGLSLSTSLSDLIEGLVAIKNPTGGKTSGGLAIAKLANRWDKSKGYATADASFVQNTKYGRDAHKGPIVSITKATNGTFTVTKVADSYEDYLKDTLSTNLMGYNVGTEENKVFTPALQQKVRVRAIKKVDTRPLKEIVEEQKTLPAVIKKTAEVIDEVETIDDTEVILNENAETLTDQEDARREEAISTAVALISRLGGNLPSLEDVDELIVSEMTTTQNVADSILITEGLTVEQEEDIIGSLASELANKEVKYENVLQNLKKNLIESAKEITESLESLEDFKGNLAVENIVGALETLKNQIAQVEKNKERLLVEASERGKRENFVVDTYEETEGENVKDYSKKSNEALPVDKLGTALKRIFAQVETGETGFLGRKKITPFKSMYDTVLLTLSSSIGSTTDFKDMMAILSEYKESNFWMESLVEKLESSDEAIQNAFVYNMHSQKVTAYFSGFTRNVAELNATLFESNSNSAVRVIKNNWKENFKRTKINKKGVLDKTELNNLYEEYLSWGVSPEKQSLETLQNWLGKFGIRMSDNSMKEMMKGELKIVKEGVAQKKTLQALFEESAGIFNILNKFLVDNKDKKGEVNFYANKKLHPFNDMHSVLDQLSYLEAKNNSRYASTTRRSGNKSLSEVENMTYFYQQVRKLKNSVMAKDSYISKLRATSFSQDSYMLKMLQEDPEFLESFDHGLMDLMSLKDIYKDTPMFAGIDELSEEDYQLALRVAYQSKGRNSRLDKNTGFKIRLTNMNTLTNSDKGRMMLLKTFVYDFFTSDQSFERDENNEFVFSADLNELMYDNYVMPELRRMFNFIKNGSVTDIKGYKDGAERFNVFPVLNTIKNKKGDTIRASIINKIEGMGKEATLKQVEDALASIKGEFMVLATKEIEKNTFAEAKRVSEKRTTPNDADFLSGRVEGTIDEKNLLAEVDFILNSKLTSMNYMQMVAGDPALYYKSKAEAISENLKEATRGSIESAVNIGKRMAAMIAPGKNLANSKNNKYIQLFLEDIEGAAENLMDIVGWHYTQEEINSTNKDTGRTYKEMIQKTVEGSKDFEKVLKSKFSDIADFIGIESTDAQEYTTVKEHLYVLEKQGRLPQEVINEIRAKIDLQNEFYSKAENKGKEIPSELSFSSVIKSKNKAVDGKTQLQILLQPIKPVYTGSMLENDVNRMMYIKSSSFPLLPELTKGRKLDDLRVQMERLEEENPGKTVRASYQTANKVGALSKDKTVKNFTDPISLENALVLDREHFKIQQDVPSKSDKVKEDYVSMGTQIFKLLFGDGMAGLEGFEYQGETVTGEELKEKFFDTFSQMINYKKQDLLDSLGLDADMNPIDEQQSKVLLQKLLLAESKSRGFSKQDLKAIELIGKTKKNFKLPLWATGNSNKFEAMLNALINNKIFKQKIPGNKFVTGSEAGFEMKEDVSEAGNIIHIGDYKGGTLKSTKTKDGVIVKAEVLMPSRFKVAGRLIDIFDDFNSKTGEGTYIKMVEGTYQLKEDMFDKSLLEQFVFRIPTSSHGLGSAVKIVGFLPPENGDLIITPKGFVAQMGQDFDIDSLTAYQYNHIVRQNGKVEKLTEENKDVFLAEKQDEIDTFRRMIEQNGEYNAETAILLNNILVTMLGEEERLAYNFYPNTKEELEVIIQKLQQELPKNSAKKILENNFIETHISVFSNPKAQNKINKALSMDYAEKQAADIQQLVDKVLDNEETFDMLSPEYQRVKMNNGSTGQVAIGIYAKAVTLHSNFQQALTKGGVHLTRKGKRVPVQIGKLVSDGSFGGEQTILASVKNKTVKALSRAVSTVLDERTNTGTDNEKAQILGKTGLNHKSAIAVDSMLALLGFDSEHEIISEKEYIKGEPFHRKKSVEGKSVYYKEYSIPYLLHSQPIIKEYFALLNKKESISNDTFSLNGKKDAENELIEKYGTAGHLIVNGKYGKFVPAKDGSDREFFESTQDNSNFTGKRLSDNIVLNDKADNKQQLQILALYTQLIQEAEGVKTAGQLIDMNNLGKSMWESTVKEEEFREYFSNLEENSNLEGIEHLVGDILYKGEVEDMTEEERESVLDLGNGIYLRPTTNQGVMVGTALSLSSKLFNGLFPAKSVYLNKVINKILSGSKVNISNSFALTRGKEFIFQEAKKYITSAQILGLFNTNAKEVRETLFTDVDNYNVSLSTYIDHLQTDDSTEFSKGIDKVRNNLFLNLLNFQYGEDGKPSLITFNNQESFEANQEAIYTAFKELIAEDISLPRITRSGKTEYYSTRKMAQELIAYSYASGGIVQGALEFHKFLPIEYLDDMVTSTTGGKSLSASGVLRRFNSLFNDDSNQVDFLREFEEQFFQNNPGMAKQAALKKHKMKDGGGEFFTLKDEVKDKPTFIAKKVATKSKLKHHKWKLFKLAESGTYYTEIAVLGALGMAEYEYQTQNLSSSVQDKEYVRNEVSGIEVQFIKDDSLGTLPATGTPLVDVVDSINRGEFGDMKSLQEISHFILPLLKKEDTFDYMVGASSAKGSTRISDGHITINTEKITSREDFAITFLHETLHNLTSRYLNDYVDANGTVKENAPSEVHTFMSVYGEYKKQLRLADPAKYDQFIKEYAEYKKKRSNNESISSDLFTLKGEEFETYYAMINPKEFLAITLSNQNEHFKKTANGMDYLAKGKGFVKKLTDIITRIVNSISKRENLAENSVALQAIKASLLVTKKGGAHNFKSHKKAALAPDAIPDAVLAEIEASLLAEQNSGNFSPEGESAGTSFLSVTEGINNKCK